MIRSTIGPPAILADASNGAPVPDIDAAVNSSTQSQPNRSRPAPEAVTDCTPVRAPEAVVPVEEKLPPRELGRIVSDKPGPVLVCVAALHGNEPSGVEALRIIFDEFSDLRLDRGALIGLVGNRRALARRVRYLAEDLNRAWIPARVHGLREGRPPVGAEDDEIAELDLALREARKLSSGPGYVLDLHSTSGPGRAFTTLDDSLVNRRFAFSFPVPAVVGLEEALSGTLLGLLTHEGWTNAGFESGQHQDPDSVTRARAAIWIAMEAAGLIDRGTRRQVAAARTALREEHEEMPRVVAVRSRRRVVPEDEYFSEPGLASFQPVSAGQVLGRDRKGFVHAAEDGLLLMPLYQEQGHEGYFLVRPIKMFWLRLSTHLRRMELERFIHWLPGVRRHPAADKTFVINQRYARWHAMEFFHLLGFRRVAVDGDRLIVERR